MTVWAACDNRATVADVVEHFRLCDPEFTASLTARVAPAAYAEKLVRLAWRCEAWQEQKLIGLVAAYFDAQTLRGFITNVSVLPDAQQCGIGGQLLTRCIERLRLNGATEINLEVDGNNVSAQRLYLKHGFIRGAGNSPLISMTYHCEKRP